MALPVALQLYSVRNEIASDMRGTLLKVKALGYDGVELAGLFGNDPSEVRKMCEEIGLAVVSAHIPYQNMAKDPHAALLRYALTGCRYAVVPYLAKEDRYGTENFSVVLENIKKIGAVANELGLTLLYHNHDFEFAKAGDRYVLDMMYEEIDAEHLQTELDTCWIKVAGEDPVEYINKYSGRAPIVHLKDFVGERSDSMYALIGLDEDKPKSENSFEYRPLGMGVQNFSTILEAAETADTEWVVVEQDDPSMGLTPLECAQKSREYLRTLGY